MMKNVGKLYYFLHGYVVELSLEWEKLDISAAFSAETHIANALVKLAKSYSYLVIAITKSLMSQTSFLKTK